MPVSSRTPDLAICLWFDGTARAAAGFYVSLFADSEITSLNLVRDGADGGVSGREIAFVGFTVAGRPFQALDGGPMFTHSPAVSVVVPCETQEEAESAKRLGYELLQGYYFCQPQMLMVRDLPPAKTSIQRLRIRNSPSPRKYR